MPRFASLLLLASSFTLAACPGDEPGPGPDDPADPDDPDGPVDPDDPVDPVDPDPPGTAVFSALDAEQLRELVAFVSYRLPLDLHERQIATGYSADYGCPVRVEDGLVDTFTGGCTIGDRTYAGVMIATNVVPIVGDDFDRDASSVIELQMFGENDDLFDGAWTKSVALPEAGRPFTLDIEYTRGGPILNGAVQYHAACVAGEWAAGHACVVDGDVDLDRYGGSFVLRGDYQVGYSDASGWLELEGVETLRVDFDASVDGCAPITIDGVDAGSYCWS